MTATYYLLAEKIMRRKKLEAYEAEPPEEKSNRYEILSLGTG